jgi:insulysin
LVLAEAHEGSALNRFNCGNLETLKQEGIRDALLKFHQTWYSSNIMRLTVIGNHDMETLEELANKLFSQVPNKDVVVPSFAEPISYDARNLGQLLTYVPVKDKDILSFTWVLPYSEMEYKSAPLSYHSNLFGHEGENSLLSYLIEQGLALELGCSYDHDLWCFTNFNVDITLTKKGLLEYERIIEAVFHYAQIVRDKGVQKYLFDEGKTVGAIKFDFADKKSGLGYCISLASRMQKFEGESLKDILRHVYITDDFDEKRIQEMSNLIADHSNLNIYLRSKSFEGKTTI